MLAPWLRATLCTMIGPAMSNTTIGTNIAVPARTFARRPRAPRRASRWPIVGAAHAITIVPSAVSAIRRRGARSGKQPADGELERFAVVA